MEQVGSDSTLRLGTGRLQKSVQATITSQTSYLAVEDSCDKEKTKLLLEKAGLSVPKGTVIHRREQLHEAAQEIGFPLVIKPLNGRQGQAVLTNLQTLPQLEQAYDFAVSEFPEYTEFIIERYCKGNDYRFTVVGGRLAAASLRQPPYVTGDGTSTLRELIERENTNPLRGSGHEKPMSEIPLEQAICYLGKSSIRLEDIPAAGERVRLMGSANLSTGGSAEDVTEWVHPSYAKLAVEAAQAIGLDIAGVDIISEDVSKPLSESCACILEVNAAPGIRMHHYPSRGTSRDVGGAIVDYLFKSREEAAVPLVAVTGTNGKTTTVRLTAHLLRTQGKTVGMTCSDGVWVGERCIDEGDCSGPASARKVLASKEVEAAVLETARGGMMREGLAFRWCDVGIVTNVTEDHLGQDGLETLEDLRKLKRTIPEVVIPGGTCILNADDEGCVAMEEYTDGRVVYFSMKDNHPVIEKSVRSGGEAWYLSDGWIMYASSQGTVRFARAADIPITINGLAKHNIANCMAALAAARALGQSLNELREGVMTFMPSAEQSRGRFNMEYMDERILIADYAHNPAGLTAIFEAVNSMPKRRLITVASAPGDRTDRSIREMGSIIGQHTDLFILKEDDDRRGRPELEAMRLLEEGALASGMAHSRMIKAESEKESYRMAWEMSAPGDMILMLYDQYNYIEELLYLLNRKLQNQGISDQGTQDTGQNSLYQEEALYPLHRETAASSTDHHRHKHDTREFLPYPYQTVESLQRISNEMRGLRHE
ncbi:cyanophycin synthetase [Paenibacillus sp. SAF-054]|uniref:cyanophycin synthetase n=1 Tax=unclassified Paenibacillus TaxID=185978 RepID=UPI003F7CF4A1